MNTCFKTSFRTEFFFCTSYFVLHIQICKKKTQQKKERNRYSQIFGLCKNLLISQKTNTIPLNLRKKKFLLANPFNTYIHLKNKFATRCFMGIKQYLSTIYPRLLSRFFAYHGLENNQNSTQLLYTRGYYLGSSLITG